MSDRHSYIIKKSAGFSLIELLMVMLIAVVILTGCSIIFLTIHRQLQQVAALNSLQEKGRLIAHLLNFDIRLIGYVGCAKLYDDFPKIKSYQDSAVKPGSDAMMISHANVQHANLRISMLDFSVLNATSSKKFSKGNTLLINDCHHAESFEVANISIGNMGQQILAAQPLQRKYQRQAEISQLEKHMYFIRKTQRKNAHGQPIYALFLKVVAHKAQELVEGVEDMKIKVSLQEHGSIFEKPLSQISGYENIVGVSIQLTLVAIESGLKKTTYLYIAVRE